MTATPLATTDALFFDRPGAGIGRAEAERVVSDALAGMDDGELFLEYRESEGLTLEEGRIRSAGFDTQLGFGLRAVLGEEAGYAHAGELSEGALRRAAATVSSVRAGRSGAAEASPRATNARLYSDANPLTTTEFAGRTATLAEIDAYARGRDPRVKQVMASMFGEWQAVQIVRADGGRVADLRPLVRLNVSVVVEQDGRGALVVTDEASVATWRAGQVAGVRSATVATPEAVSRAIRHLGANLIAVEPAGASIFLLKQIGERFRQGGAPVVPDWLEAEAHP